MTPTRPPTPPPTSASPPVVAAASNPAPSSATSRSIPGQSSRRRRSEVELAAQQLTAIGRFNDARGTVERAAATTASSREMRMDAARSLEVLRREHQALVSRTHEQLRHSGDLLRSTAVQRAVLVHRSDWFLDRIAQVLQEQGVLVVARLDNGADAVGLAVAEQPDLLLVEDTLAMVPGEQVVREVRRYCPHTAVVAQVANAHRVDVLLEAGASAVVTRHVPPVEVAQRMLSLVAS